ncbi:AMP-binding protein, partial [Nocardioides salarius]|uniref:AMP-binding protein n=1 Tax=Nocardioides salarius TaxID=374513 RepID=UPI0030F51496
MISTLLTSAGTVGTSLRVLTRAGVLRPYSPVVLARLAKVLKDWGTGPAGGFASLAVRAPGEVGVVDELGELTWAQLHARSNALARALRGRGIGEGDAVAVMCRNHRFFLDVTCAAAKLGADALYLNTAFAGPQLVEVLGRDRPAALVHDQEFPDL